MGSFVRTVGGPGSDLVYDVAVDESGRRVVVGSFENAAVFGSPSLAAAAVNPDTVYGNGLFDAFVASYDSRGSLGLYTLKERAELISGVFQIESTPGRGTKILIYVPFSDAGVERLWQGRR